MTLLNSLLWREWETASEKGGMGGEVVSKSVRRTYPRRQGNSSGGRVCGGSGRSVFLHVQGSVVKHVLPERPAEVQGLEHGVAIARVAIVDQSEVVLVRGKVLRAYLLL